MGLNGRFGEGGVVKADLGLKAHTTKSMTNGFNMDVQKVALLEVSGSHADPVFDFALDKMKIAID